ncbi:MAG: dephospho-CoA kinase [Armatimonadetes bacterium]|nr:dephospho-CoA kinase [Armatimonadota bacterium]
MKIAVTGGVAEGKSTLMRFLSDYGLRCLSADDVARQVRQEPETRTLLASSFGLEAKELEAGLRQVLADPHGRRRLNAIMHPLVWSRVQASAYDVAEVPLLVETCLHNQFDYVVLVTCGPEMQRARLKERGLDDISVQRLLASQLSFRAKKPFADLIVRTDGTIEDVQRAAGKIDSIFRGIA